MAAALIGCGRARSNNGEVDARDLDDPTTTNVGSATEPPDHPRRTTRFPFGLIAAPDRARAGGAGAAQARDCRFSIIATLGSDIEQIHPPLVLASAFLRDLARLSGGQTVFLADDMLADKA